MRKFATLVVTGCALLAAGAVSAQEQFPSRPMRILCGFGVGGGTDVVARLIKEVGIPTE